MGAVPTKMMYVKADGVPWHGIGTALDEPPTMIAALKASGQDWDVALAPCRAELPDGTFLDTGKQAIYRTDSRIVLGIASDNYQKLNNRDAFEIADAVVSDLGIEPRYVTAGDLFGGKQVFIVAKLPDDIIIGANDRQEQYLLLRTGHDGGTSFDVLPTSVRVVCQNTLNLALGSTADIRYSTNHVGDWAVKTGQIRSYFKEAMMRLGEFKNWAETLVDLPATPDAEELMRQVLFPEIRESVGRTWLDTGNWQQPIQFVGAGELESWNKRRDSRLVAYDSVRGEEDGSLWGLFNTATGYADQARPHQWFKDKEIRFRNVMFRRGAELKSSAIKVVREFIPTEAVAKGF